MRITYIIVNDYKNPERNSEEFTMFFEQEAHKHITKYFEPVAKWANGAVIIEKN